MKIALSIAGSDSGAGAGIQADIKTFSALGVYGCTAITAVTAQNTRGVSEISELPQNIIEKQISAILHDLPPSAVKIGMVYSKETIGTVSELLYGAKFPIVLDPILAAGTGAKLLREDAVDAFVSRLMPLCTLITPNRMEAERLSGIRIKTVEDGIEAANRIVKNGAKSVIVKGGHIGSKEVTDILVDSRAGITKIRNKRVFIGESHGSGCNFSAAVTAYLARGHQLVDACTMANEYVHIAISNTVKVGKGIPVTNPLSVMYRDAMKYRVVAELQVSVEAISEMQNFHTLIPETQTNFVYAVAGGSELSDVAGVRGRIVKIGNAAVPASYIEFGASMHVASAVLAFMTINPSVRAAINIRHDPRLVKICESLFRVSSYDRRAEPKATKSKEGFTMNWGTLAALSKNPGADVIYHEGGVGKEPMINVFGRTPAEVVGKIRKILKNQH